MFQHPSPPTCRRTASGRRRITAALLLLLYCCCGAQTTWTEAAPPPPSAYGVPALNAAVAVADLGIPMQNANEPIGSAGVGPVVGVPRAGGHGGMGEIWAPRAAAQLGPNEPSCEALRAMWRFSKRQSRAAEMTNELPTFRDPFAYNVWDPYVPTARSTMGG